MTGAPAPKISTAPLTAIAMIREDPSTSLTLGGDPVVTIIESELGLMESTRGGQPHVIFARRITDELVVSACEPTVEVSPLRLKGLREKLGRELKLNLDARHDRDVMEFDLNLGIAWNWVKRFYEAYSKPAPDA